MPELTSPYRGAVLFDLDGTLIDTAPDFAQSINALRTENGLAPLSIEKIRHFVSGGAAAMIEVAFETVQDIAKSDQISQLLRLCDQNLGTKAQVFEGIPDLLSKLESQNLAWVIITNRNHRFTEPLLKKLALLPSDNIFICPEDVSEAKPNPEGILLAMEKLGLDKEKCIYVGDHARDIEAANRADIYSIACGYGYLLDDEDIAAWGASKIIKTVSDLDAAIFDYFIHV